MKFFTIKSVKKLFYDVFYRIYMYFADEFIALLLELA